jgi:hypothetical protein
MQTNTFDLRVDACSYEAPRDDLNVTFIHQQTKTT